MIIFAYCFTCYYFIMTIQKQCSTQRGNEQLSMHQYASRNLTSNTVLYLLLQILKDTKFQKIYFKKTLDLKILATRDKFQNVWKKMKDLGLNNGE
jgi:hypothetical protein